MVVFELVKDFKRTFKAMSFTRSVVDVLNGFFECLMRDVFKVGFFRKILTKQAVGIFIRPSLP